MFMSLLVTSSIEVMHYSLEEFRYMEWDTHGNAIEFLIDQIVEG